MARELAAAPSGAVAPDEAKLTQAAVEVADLALAVSGDAEAFGRLYDRYVERVYWYAHTRTASAEDAQDLTQQVFVQMIAALPRYQAGKAPFAAWLFGIARHVTADYRRRARPTVTWDDVPPALQPAAQIDVEAGAMQQEALEHLRALLATLPPEARELLALRFAARLTAAEIAAVIGKSEAATKKRLARTIQRLNEQYRESLR